MKKLNIIRLVSLAAVIVAIAGVHMAFSQDEQQPDPDDALMTAVRDADTPQELEAGLAQLHCGNQKKLEAKILWTVANSKDVDYYNTLLPQIDKALPTWKISDAMALRFPAQIDATRHYMKALQAFQKGDVNTAKSEIMEAIWLDPNQNIYTNLVAQINPPPSPKVPMELVVTTTHGKKVKLAEYITNKKALYVQVWATWCGPCRLLLPALQARYDVLLPQGVAVVGMNSELGHDNLLGGDLAKAKRMLESLHIDVPCLIEPKEGTFTQLLNIDSVPRALLIAPDGTVLFNGHPMDDGLVIALKKLGATINLMAGLEDNRP
jgi:thiol-disulfide isomerase/thioredoxin